MTTKNTTISSTALSLAELGFSQATIASGNQLVFTPSGGNLRYRLDGTAPTATVGHILPAGKTTKLPLHADIKVIRETTDVTLTVEMKIEPTTGSGGGGGGSPEVPGTLIWGWTFGDFSKATYDAYVDPANPATAFTLEANGRITGQGGDNRMDMTLPMRFNWPPNYETPTIDADGKLRAFSKSDATPASGNHSMWRADNGGLFTSRWYLAPNKRYRLDTAFNILSTSDWDNLTWAIPFQLHPGSHPPGHNQQAPINMYLRGGDGVFRVQLLGNTNNPPGAESWTDQNTFDFAFATGFHTFRMEWFTDYTGAESDFLLKMDGDTKVNTQVPHGLKWSAANNSVAYLYPAMGIYTSGDQPANFPELLWTYALLYEL
jgi:hypothetical protein